MHEVVSRGDGREPLPDRDKTPVCSIYGMCLCSGDGSGWWNMRENCRKKGWGKEFSPSLRPVARQMVVDAKVFAVFVATSRVSDSAEGQPRV
eukprot:2961408-Pyramimonas_sp.AAC.1